MLSLTREFLGLIEQNVNFEYHAGESTWVSHPYAFDWRVLPSLVVAQVNYDCLVERREEPPVRIRAGQTLCLLPGVTHRIAMLSRRAGYSHWSHIQCELFQGFSLFHLMEPPLCLEGNRSRRIGRLNRALAEIARAEPALESIPRRQALGWELITTLLENVSVAADRIDLARQASRLAPVLNYIGENLAKPISHELLARAAGLSPSRFHVLFRSALGSAPYQYVQKLRLKKAQQLLIRTDRSVAEIGREVGHPDPYHFSRMFRRNIGISPAGYRKQMVRHSF